ncbi:hypothetical protein ABPG72_020309 [Tetrahymena utriculariae]
MTEKLIDQYFPSLNATLYYNHEDYDSNLLGASKSKAPKHTESTAFQKVKPKFTLKHNKDGSTELKKSYTQDDMVRKLSILKKPNLKCQSKFAVKDGKVRQNSEVLSFSLNQDQQKQFTLTSSNGQNNTQELIGSVNVHRKFVEFYEQNIYYRQLNTAIEESGNILLQPQKTTLQEGSDLIFQKDYKFFQQNILINNLYLSASCDPIAKSQDYQTNEYKVLDSFDPIYGDLIKFPLKLNVTLKYGQSFTKQKILDSNQCQLQFKPYVQPHVIASASVNFLNVGEAGITARGDLVGTLATFEADVDKNQNVHLGIDVLVKPYNYDISIFYSVVQFPISSGLVSVVKIIASNVQVQSDYTLDGSNMKTIPIKSDKSEKQFQKNLFSKNFNIKDIPKARSRQQIL